MVAVAVVVVLAFLALLAWGGWVGLQSIRRSIEARMVATDAELRRLGDASVWGERGTADMRREISGFAGVLAQLRVREEERREREEQGWATLHRVASVLTGGQRSGRTGENVLREALSHLPPSMVETDFRVNGRVVEFCLVLPDGRRLPIDSKWAADRELQALAETEDAAERDRLVRAIERTVAERAREVAAYRDPALTTSVVVAAVPDAAYAVLRRAHADAYRQGVIVIPYSVALPVVLFLFSIVARFGTAGDVEACLTDLAASLDAMGNVIENRVARASIMLANAADELRGSLGKARATLVRARERDAAAPSLDGAGADLMPAEEPVRPRLVGIQP
jgi:hypothetical protein